MPKYANEMQHKFLVMFLHRIMLGAKLAVDLELFKTIHLFSSFDAGSEVAAARLTASQLTLEHRLRRHDMKLLI